jgi:hypothetical protein
LGGTVTIRHKNPGVKTHRESKPGKNFFFGMIWRVSLRDRAWTLAKGGLTAGEIARREEFQGLSPEAVSALVRDRASFDASRGGDWDPQVKLALLSDMAFELLQRANEQMDIWRDVLVEDEFAFSKWASAHRAAVEALKLCQSLSKDMRELIDAWEKKATEAEVRWIGAVLMKSVESLAQKLGIDNGEMRDLMWETLTGQLQIEAAS